MPSRPLARYTAPVMEAHAYDVAVIGGGIIGLSTARAILRGLPSLRLVVLEKEPRLAAHQTARNSGVIHSGIYYRPGSLKARLCVTGARLLAEFCEARGIPLRRCGKLIVAVDAREVPRLETLYQRGVANRVPAIARIDAARIRELEPEVRGVGAIHLPQVAVVDYVAVADAFALDVAQAGGRILTSTPVAGAIRAGGAWRLTTPTGEIQARFLVNCGGLFADRIARWAGDRARVQLVPFRGEYYALPPARADVVRGLIYPVPEPAMPFLGVHFTKTLAGGVQVGPNAVLAMKREGYRRTDVSWRDCVELLTSPGVWRMAARHWRAGLTESARSVSRQAFLRAAQRLVPSLAEADLIPGMSGVRAQAVDVHGTLLDDFVLREGPHALHVYNAPSPAATASLAIAERIVQTIATPLSELRPSPLVAAPTGRVP